MFRAVRNWAGSGRGKHTVRLFIFELTVVTLGILIAQEVQGLAQDRAARAHMEDERARAQAELRVIHLSALEWKAAIPCLDRRMTDVMAGRVAGGPDLVRPSLSGPPYTPPDDDALILIEKRYGIKVKSQLTSLETNNFNLHTVMAAIISDWGRLTLLDPANGPVGERDREQARVAAADIKAQLRSASIINGDVLKRLGRLGVDVALPDDVGHGPAHSCAAIWKSGRIDPPLGER